MATGRPDFWPETVANLIAEMSVTGDKLESVPLPILAPLVLEKGSRLV